MPPATVSGQFPEMPETRYKQIGTSMTFIPVPDVAQLNFSYAADLGFTWSTAVHFKRDGGWNTSTLELLATTAADAWEELADGIFTANCNLVGTNARDLSSASGAYFDNVLSSPVAGVRSGAATPMQVAMSVTFRTALRGRSYRGRIYHYGLANEDRQNEKLWQTAVGVTVQNAYDAVFDAIEAETTADHVVASRYSGKASRITGISTLVTTVVARTKIATQRRRLNQ